MSDIREVLLLGGPAHGDLVCVEASRERITVVECPPVSFADVLPDAPVNVKFKTVGYRPHRLMLKERDLYYAVPDDDDHDDHDDHVARLFEDCAELAKLKRENPRLAR